MSQTHLDFDPPARARRTDPETSKAAARKVNAGTLTKLVLDALAERAMTTKELGAYLDRPHISISPRMRPLEARGLVKRAGIRDGSTVWALVRSAA